MTVDRQRIGDLQLPQRQFVDSTIAAIERDRLASRRRIRLFDGRPQRADVPDSDRQVLAGSARLRLVARRRCDRLQCRHGIKRTGRAPEDSGGINLDGLRQFSLSALSFPGDAGYAWNPLRQLCHG